MNKTTLRIALLGALAALSAAFAGSGAQAQNLTEQFIPIGQSPGASGRTAEVGTVSMIDVSRNLIACELNGVEEVFIVTPQTEVYLDRSASQTHNLTMDVRSLRIGDRVEIKRDDPRAEVAGYAGTNIPLADWIKVDAAARD